MFQTLRKSIGKKTKTIKFSSYGLMRSSTLMKRHPTTFASVLKQDTEQAVGTLIFHICNEQTTNYFFYSRVNS